LVGSAYSQNALAFFEAEKVATVARRHYATLAEPALQRFGVSEKN
jgi:hypothetical protein